MSAVSRPCSYCTRRSWRQHHDFLSALEKRMAGVSKPTSLQNSPLQKHIDAQRSVMPEKRKHYFLHRVVQEKQSTSVKCGTRHESNNPEPSCDHERPTALPPALMRWCELLKTCGRTRWQRPRQWWTLLRPSTNVLLVVIWRWVTCMRERC